MFLGIFVGLLVVGLLKERSLGIVVEEGALWAGIAATIFIVQEEASIASCAVIGLKSAKAKLAQ